MAGISRPTAASIDFKVLRGLGDARTRLEASTRDRLQDRHRARTSPIDADWATTKDGGEIDAVTAATISSRAALEAISAASAQFQAIREAVQKGVQATL
jgi:Na+-translocating ferredoxin:NAD+ oxidoreductase RnfG subunit